MYTFSTPNRQNLQSCQYAGQNSMWQPNRRKLFQQINSEEGFPSCDQGVNVIQTVAQNTQQPVTNMTSGMDFGRNPDHHHSELNSHSAQFGQNHPLGVLGNLTALNMNVPNLSGFPSLSGLQHGDVLEKLKMQVRDMKVGLMGEQNDFAALHASFGANALQQQQQHQQQQQQQQQTGSGGSVYNSGEHRASGGPNGGNSGGGSGGGASANTNGGNYPFTLPNPPINKDGNPGSNSSTSSETSTSSQQNNGWSFEEQFKQVRQLYEINDDPKRKEFLDDLFLFMQKRGTPINRLPIMAKSVLDLFELYKLVIARGGLVDVINKKLWQEIIKGLHLPSSITSAAFTLRTQYMKYLYPYECEKNSLSTPAELQAAIDGNRREGRRSSYGQFDAPSVQRSPIPQGIQQMSPLSLVTHVNQQQHHRLLGAPNVGQIPNILPAEFEQRMLDYIKLFHPKEMKREQSPEQLTPRDALNALEMSRVALWNMYNNNTSPPNSINTSPPELQREALNLSDSPPHHISVKRERDHPMDFTDRSMGRDFHSGIPPAKRSNNNTIAAAAQQLQQQQQQQLHGHGRSLTPQKLNMSSHDEDDARSDGTPINLRGDNGMRHHDEDIPDDEEEDEDEEMNMAEDAHPLALNRITEHAAALAAAQRERDQVQVNHLASLNLSLLERERERCEDADKLKRQQQQQLQLEQLQREQLLHHQQQLQLLERERERELQREHEREIQKQQQQQQQQQQEQQHISEQNRQNGDRLSGAARTDNHIGTIDSDRQNCSRSANGSTSPGLGATGTTMGIMGMQFKLTSRGDAAKGDQQLVVSMEFNGVQYEGVLFANPSSTSLNSSSSQTTKACKSITNITSSSSNARAENSASCPLLVTAANSSAVAPSSSSPAGSIHSSSSNNSASPTGSLIISPAKTNSSSLGGDEPMATGLSAPPQVITPRPPLVS
ncbi:protein dead ringer isoform X3 [Toxorhynchites rutilus septentrionalis]|uniref:protein dead ringer isoform X3 n=1 Tax=Toxorhynchites rutilus septentrionalis TaxID=329112 RepID=UPI002478A0A6|nr:protein dead ringer isoform X3 [Toxorhynchites rutilus septentrionalis]